MASVTVAHMAAHRQDLHNDLSSVCHSIMAWFKSKSQFLSLNFSFPVYIQEAEKIAWEGSYLLMNNIYFIAKR